MAFFIGSDRGKSRGAMLRFFKHGSTTNKKGIRKWHTTNKKGIRKWHRYAPNKIPKGAYHGKKNQKKKPKEDQKENEKRRAPHNGRSPKRTGLDDWSVSVGRRQRGMKTKKPENQKKYRLSGRHLFLTYSQCSLEREELLAQLKDKFETNKKNANKIVNYVISTENHESDGEHLHAYLELENTCDIRDSRKLDLKKGDLEYHGNYQTLSLIHI